MLALNRKTSFIDRAMLRKLLAVPLLWASSALPGCGEAPSSPSVRVPSGTSEVEIRSVNSAELRALVADADRPVLVEFSVLSGCYRCDDMRSPIRQKAADMQQHADVVRIDFNSNRRLAEQVGATVCPSYVVYSQGAGCQCSHMANVGGFRSRRRRSSGRAGEWQSGFGSRTGKTASVTMKLTRFEPGGLAAES